MAQKQNIDWSAPSAQAYHTALSAKALDDTSTIATGVLLFTPPGAISAAINIGGTSLSYGSAYLNGEVKQEIFKDGMSKGFEVMFNDNFGKVKGGKINGLLDLSGFYDLTVPVFDSDDKD